MVLCGGLFLFHECRQRFFIPFLCGIHVDFPPKAVRKHSAHIVHGQRIAGFCFQQKQAESFCKVRFLIFATIEILSCFLVLFVPPFLSGASAVSSLCVFLFLPLWYGICRGFRYQIRL